MRILIAGGGTGGHVFPALAVAQQLRRSDPAGQILFVGGRGGLEERLVPIEGFDLQTLAVGKLKGTRLLGRLKTLGGLAPAAVRGLSIVNRFGPDVVVGVGGYASGPVTLAAWLRRVPIVLLEQNAVGGMTNRMLSRFADRVVLSYAEAARSFAARKTVHLGNPVRPALLEALAGAADREIATESPRLLVLGGSQGASRLNELVAEAAPALFEALPGLSIEHQTGNRDHASVASRYEAWPAAHAVAFIDDMAAAYAAADLALSRSGATTLAELAVAGVPAVLVPYPHAADDHQVANARHLVDAGAAKMVLQHELDAASLTAQLIELLSSPERMTSMRTAMLACGRPDAAAAVVELLGTLAAR